MNLLLQTSSHSSDNAAAVGDGERVHLDPMETLQDVFDWLAVLWVRGLCHDNPQGKQYVCSYFLIHFIITIFITKLVFYKLPQLFTYSCL